MAQTKIFTSIATAAAPIVPLTTKNRNQRTKTVIQDRWVCDKCRKESFLTFDEAVEHEKTCQPVIVLLEDDNTLLPKSKSKAKAKAKPKSKTKPKATIQTRKPTNRRKQPKTNNNNSNTGTSNSLAPIFVSSTPASKPKVADKKQNSTFTKAPTTTITNLSSNKKNKSNNNNVNKRPLASIFTGSKPNSSVPNSMNRKPSVTVEEKIWTTTAPPSSIWPVAMERKRPRTTTTASLSTAWSCPHELPHIVHNQDDNHPTIGSYARLDTTMTSPGSDKIGQYSQELSFLPSIEQPEETVQWHLEQLLTPPRRSRKRTNNASPLWVDKYGSTITINQQILNFVQDERSYCPQDLFEEEDARTRLLLVTGPTASGKTQMVHAAAKACKCVLMEINTTEPRGSAKLKRRVQDTSTCHSMVYACNADNNDHSNLPSDDDDDDDAFVMGKKKNITLILIDEVDLMFEQNGDAGFWSTLGSLAKKAQCPIVLTAQTVPTQMAQWDYKHVHLDMPSSVECAGKMTQIVRQEKMKFKVADSEKMKRVAQLCRNDIRRLSHELQLFASSTTTTKSNHYDNLPFGMKPIQHVQLPMAEVTSVSPHEVSSEEYSAVTIQGQNFSLGARVFVGDQECTTVKVMDANTLVVIIPPFPNDGKVNPKTGYYRNSVKKSWTSHYQPLNITFPDRPTVHLTNNDNDTHHGNFYIYYQFQSLECHLDLIINQSSDYENEFMDGHSFVAHPQEEKKIDMEPSMTQSPPPPLRQVTVERLNSLELENEVLQKAIRDCALDDRATLSRPKYDICSKEMDQISQLANDLEYASDVALYQDVSSDFGCPTLGGPVLGFGTELIDKNEFRSSNDKPPSLDQIIKNGWNDSACVYGTSDAYSTFPSAIRDRQLLAQKSHELSYDVINDEEVEDKELLQEESFCSYPDSLPLSMPQHYQHSVKLLQSRRLDRFQKLQSLAIPLLGDSPKMSSMCFGFKIYHTQGNPTLDSRLALDYLPCIRQIAKVELRKDVEYQKVMTESSSSDRPSSRRRTRRSQLGNKRDHFFDALINSSRQWHNGRDICKQICDEYLL